MPSNTTTRRILYFIGFCGIAGCFPGSDSVGVFTPPAVTFPAPPNGRITVPGGSSHIVFVSTRDGNRELYIMNSDGSQQTRLTYSPASEERAPSISPNGKLIAFTSNIDGDEDIWVMSVDGSAIRQVTNRPGRDFRATFHPNNKRVTFTSELTGDGEIFAVDLDGTNVQRLSDDKTVDTDSVFDPSGAFVAYSSGSDAAGNLKGALGLYTVNVTTKVKKAIASADSANPQGQIQHIRSANWAPNGQNILFESALGPVGDAASVGAADIYVIAATAAANSLVRLTSAATNEDDPAFSPDNTRMAFRSNNGGNSDIYTASATAASTPAQWIRLTTAAAEDSDPWWGVVQVPAGCGGNLLSANLPYITTRSTTVRQNGNNSTTPFPGFLEAGDHDEGGHKTVQGFLGFSINGIPNDPNKICSAILHITENRTQAGSVGQPFTQLGNLYVERIAVNQYGALNLNAPVVNNDKVSSRVALQAGADYVADVTEMVREMLLTGQNEAALRLRFATFENNDNGNDLADFFTSGGSQPRLVVTYSQ